MPFRFPLEAVLRLRRGLEHQQELRLRAANQLVSRVRHLIDVLDSRLRELQTDASGRLLEGAAGAELRFGLLCQDSLRRQRLALQRELLRVKHLRDEQQQLYQKARLERETFEAVREERLREYQREAARREQRELDESFLLRRISSSE